MQAAAEALEFEKAAALRDQIYDLRQVLADKETLPLGSGRGLFPHGARVAPSVAAQSSPPPRRSSRNMSSAKCGEGVGVGPKTAALRDET